MNGSAENDAPQGHASLSKDINHQQQPDAKRYVKREVKMVGPRLLSQNEDYTPSFHPRAELSWVCVVISTRVSRQI